MASFVTNDQAVVIELASDINGDTHVNELSDFMTPYGLMVAMNLSDNILRMVQDSESIEQLMDLQYNQRYRPADGRTGASIYFYLDWNAKAWLLFVYENRVIFKRCRQTKTSVGASSRWEVRRKSRPTHSSTQPSSPRKW